MIMDFSDIELLLIQICINNEISTLLQRNGHFQHSAALHSSLLYCLELFTGTARKGQTQQFQSSWFDDDKEQMLSRVSPSQLSSNCLVPTSQEAIKWEGGKKNDILGIVYGILRNEINSE
nr:hypothetical protein Iba_chr11aCG17390 [Ipomoea batatas]